jgi:hypothetical protein
MGKATWQPKWWKPETHGSGWERVKEALRRDWEQTKADVHAGGRELDQDVGDTVRQMAGKEEVPPTSQPNSKSLGSDMTTRRPSWEEVETPMMYGYGARQQYGAQDSAWNDGLERKLRTEWEEARGATGRTWDEVRPHVRRGFESWRS